MAYTQSLQHVASVYNAGEELEGGSEILKVSGTTLVTTNGVAAVVDVYSIADPSNPVKIATLDVSKLLPNFDVSALASRINSVDIKGNTVVAAYQSANAGGTGSVVVFDISDLNNVTVKVIPVGVLPDSVLLNAAGTMAYTANEGELAFTADGQPIDGMGSISVIDLASGAVTNIGFDGFSEAQLSGLRIFPQAIEFYGSVTEAAKFDIEPEYVALSDDESTLFVTLQEAVAVAKVDLTAVTPGMPVVGSSVMTLLPMGTKDHSLPGNGLDYTDKDDGVNIELAPLHGLYMPDAIASFTVGGTTYFATANEGDDRGDYGDAPWGDAVRAGDANIDSTVAAGLDLSSTGLGRINISAIDGDIDGDGDIDVLHSYGARSFTVWDESGNLVFDSGDMLEQLTLQYMPDAIDNGRADNKGPEPEALEAFTLNGSTYLAVGTERHSTIFVFNLDNPAAPTFEYAVNQLVGNGVDWSPEEVEFASINGTPYLFTANEMSGTIGAYEISNNQALNNLYNVILDRDADYEGFQHYSAKLASGTSYEQVAREILASNEFATIGLNSVDAKVEAFYTHGLERASDATGKAYWLQEATANGLEVAALGLALSAEAVGIYGG